jgi:hypothetical protein
VYFYGRRLQGALGLLRVKVGRQRMDIDVVAGGTFRLRYRASYGWHLMSSGAALSQV